MPPGAPLRLRDGARRAHAPEARELRARAHQAAGRLSGDRPEHARSSSSTRAPATARASAASRSTAGRRRAAARAPLLLRDLLPAAGAGPDDRSTSAPPRARSAQGERAAPGGREPPFVDRQLPGRLGADDAGRAGDPDDVGPIVINGAPMSYWAGVAGQEPDALFGRAAGRQLAGVAAGDLGDGKFDGAHLVNNFERLDPGEHATGRSSTTCIRRSTRSAPRFLEFERWWGGHFLMNREEIDWIVQNLFVGNKLSAGEVAVVRRQAPRRPARHPVADHRVRVLGRQHHAAAAGAGLDRRPLRERRRDPPHGRRSSTACTRRPAISASSSRRASRGARRPSSRAR